MNHPLLSPEFWRRCSSCKNPIAYKATHYVCSVSTCNRKRIGYVFCSVHCWERHLPGARHRDAAAVEATAPTYEQWKAELESDGGGTKEASASSANTQPASTEGPRRVIVREAAGTPAAQPKPSNAVPKEILVVVSKLKAYIKARSDMNTSDAVMEVLSDKLREICDDAIDKARQAGRKTVMERDFDET